MTLRSRLTASLLAIALLAAGLVLAPSAGRPAMAASTGAGYPGITPYGGFLGNYVAPDGSRVYCIDSGAAWPSGATGAPETVTGIQTQWGGWLSVTEIRKLNYALLRWGQTADPTTAAAVSAVVYAYTSNYARSVGAGHGAGAHYINGNIAVLTAYNWIWEQTGAHFAGTPGSATVSIDMANSLDGSVSITTTPASATGTLELSGAVVAATNETSIEVGNGSVIPIHGMPAADALGYEISASATFTADAGAAQNLLLYRTGSQQRTIRGAGPATQSFGAHDSSGAIDLRFAPVVQTQVAARFVDGGSGFVDTVTASVADGSPAWRTLADGTPVPIVATGTLFGPFAEQPDVAATPPAGAPVVGSETLTLTGPGEYRSAGTLSAPTAGFYTWVWAIDAASQGAEVAELLPTRYSFADQFGLVAESHVVPMAITAVSQVSATEIGLGGEVGDQLSVSLTNGSWLSSGGSPLPAVFDGTAYFVAGDTPPALSESAPPGATVVGTATITATGPGIYESETTVVAPQATAGYISWVWSLSSASEFAPYFEPWADQFGLPAETTRVAPPTVSTLAQPAAAIGDEVHDTALVGGVLPAQPASLVFEAYLQASGDEATCDATTLVFSSAANPVIVTSVGSYDSPVTRFDTYGTYFWVESLFSHDGQLIHRGECGLPEEITLVAPGVVITQAVAHAAAGGAVRDTAFVSGLIPKGATLVFEAFAQHGVSDGPLCDESTRVFTSQPVTLYGSGRYESEATRLTEAGTYYWVETLYDRNGDTLHRGRCGVSSETTTVGATALASTGASALPLDVTARAVLALGLLALGLVALGITFTRRRWLQGE